MFSRATVIMKTLSTMFPGNKDRIKEKVIPVPKKPLLLVFPYIRILNCCKLHIVFNSQNK